MNLQPVPQPETLNGFGPRKGGARDLGPRLDNMSQSGKSDPGRVPSAVGGSVDAYESPSRDRLVYLTTCLVGRPVEVHVKNGSVFTGIFYSTDAEKDFGIVLKIARLVREGTQQGEFVNKAPSKTLIIPAKELVQVIAKDVAITSDGLASEAQREKSREMMTDSAISQSRHVEVEREFELWKPDADDPQCPELENIFDGPINRNWDQFKANNQLFGVKSTYNEELYTTKLERGPQMREMEKEAIRIAREIEGEDTQDLHLAEERGHHLNDDFDIDEETRFSSVLRGRGVDDSGYEEDEEIVLDACNSETFGDSSTASFSNRHTDSTSLDSSDRAVMPSSSPMMDEEPSTQSTSSVDSRSGSTDAVSRMFNDLSLLSSSDRESRIHNNLVGDPKDSVEKQSLAEDPNLPISMDSQSSTIDKTISYSKGRSSANSASAVSQASSKGFKKPTSSEASKAPGDMQPVISRERPGSSTSSTSDHVRPASAASGPGLSPSSSVGSLSSGSSTLNPNAKEFKLNPNAKSFKPVPTTARPPSPVSDASFYYPPNVPPVPHMPGMQVAYGMAPPFPGHQQVMFNPMQPPHAYFHPNGVQYGQQQMIPGQPRLYMPYQQGRDY